jgi:hypothetical protein
VYPIVRYPLNIPPPFRHKFPFFLNLYAGKKTKKVSVGLLHSEALKSIKQYNEAPVVWSDGVQQKLYVIQVRGDMPERADIKRQVRHNGFHACSQCINAMQG